MQSIRFRYFRQIRKAVPEQAVKAYLTKVLNEKEAEVKTTRESIEKMKKSLSEYRAMTPDAYVKMKDEQAKAETERTKSREKKKEEKAKAEKKSAEKPEAKAPADVTAAADAAKESAKGKGGKNNVSKAAEPATVTPAKKAADALETMLRKQA